MDRLKDCCYSLNRLKYCSNIQEYLVVINRKSEMYFVSIILLFIIKLKFPPRKSLPAPTHAFVLPEMTRHHCAMTIRFYYYVQLRSDCATAVILAIRRVWWNIFHRGAKLRAPDTQWKGKWCWMTEQFVHKVLRFISYWCGKNRQLTIQ